MITNKGKDIIAKYMIGQAPSYASYLAIGCGATPDTYYTDDIYGKTVLNNGGVDIVDSNGLVTAQLTLSSSTSNSYSIGDKIIVRDVDDFFDGVYFITAIDQTHISYKRTPGNHSTLPSSSTSIGTVALAVELDSTSLNKKNLDFEMIRVPIISRGYVTDNNVSQIVFTAELPTEERYEISEVGIYSGASNPSASNNDSRTLFSFSQSETWKYHHTTTEDIPYIVEALDIGATQSQNIISTTKVVFQANANNSALISESRVTAKETTRFLNNTIFLRGDLSGITLTGNNFNTNNKNALTSDHIHLTGANLNLNTNALTDEIRVAFATVYKEVGFTEPDSVRIAVEFAHDETADSENARMEIQSSQNYSNRYNVVSSQLKDLKTTSNFLWSSVKVVKIFATAVPKSGRLASDYYIALDAIRLENTTTTNPLYGMTGYSIIRNGTGHTITKNPNTSNLVEFRFGMGIE